MSNRIIKVLKTPKYAFEYIIRKGNFDEMPDEKYLKMRFKYRVGYELNLDNPQTFNEKLQWLKLHDRKPKYTKMADKYDAKQYVTEKIGKEYIIPTLGVWDKFEDINFKELPNQFVIKCTHDSGGLVICKNKSKMDIEAARNKINKCLNRNFYKSSREYPYKNIKPRVIAEQFMVDESSYELKDYKFMCFNGEVKCLFTNSNRFGDELYVTFYDLDWNIMPFERYYHKDPNGVKKPVKFKEMIELAKVLSRGIPFLRVDFYEVLGQIYFGELTFYPGSGFEPFIPIEWDYKLGSWINLEGINQNGQ